LKLPARFQGGQRVILLTFGGDTTRATPPPKTTRSRPHQTERMKKVLIFFTSSYPFGPGDTFIANEMTYLTSAFDEVVIVSNNTTDDPIYPLAAGVTYLRVSYELSLWDRLASAFMILLPEPREELGRIRRQYRMPLTPRAVKTVLVSWRKARKFSRIIGKLARAHPGTHVFVYSYWANDMALAGALARKRGWVHRAICRAHGWDVYFERAEVGFLPFRHYLATNLDRYLFISEDGRRYFENRIGASYASVSCSRLGTASTSLTPRSSQHPFVLVSCSSMIPLKRVDLIATALQHVRSAVTWIHIGDGPTRPVVEEACSRLPSHVSVELLGQLLNTEVTALYRSRRPSVFINVSDSEGIPVSIMEAMSAGVPVIATSVGGVPEIVADKKNGLLLSPGATDSDIAGAIESFISMSPQEYHNYAAGAWSTWNGEFNADRNYTGFLGDLLGES